MFRRGKLILFIFTTLPYFGWGQLSADDQRAVDSLKLIAEGDYADSIKIRAYLEWDNLIYYVDPILDAELNQKMIEIANRNIDDKKLSIKEKEFFAKYKGQALNNTGLVLIDFGNYFEALKSLQESLLIAEYFEDSVKQSSALNNIGMIYTNLKMPERALDYYQQSFTLFEFDAQSYSIYYNNIGLCYFDLKDYKRARECFDSSFFFAIQVDDFDGMGNTLSNIGLIFMNEGQVDSSIYYYGKSIEAYLKVNNENGTAHAFKNIGLSYLELGEYNKSIDFCNRAFVLGSEWKDISVQKESCECLYFNYKTTGNVKNALKYHELYVAYKDSMDIAGKGQELIKQDFQFNYKRKHVEDSLAFLNEQELQKLAYESTLHKKQTTQYFLYAGIAASLLIGVLMFRGYIRKKKDHEIIAIQKKEVETQKHIVEEKNKEITDSINYAKRIQEAILPTAEHIKSVLSNHFILYKPKDIVAGDFYWFEEFEDHIFFAVADCTGHGVPGAMVSVVCHNALNRALHEFKIFDPGKLLDKTRELVQDTFENEARLKSRENTIRDGMDIALCVLKKNSTKILFAGANNGLYLIRNKQLIETNPDKQPIGKYAEEKPFTTQEVEVKPNDIIYLYTDGYADQFGGNEGKKFKYKQLKETLLNLSNQDLSIQKEKLDSIFENWKGNLEQIDDVCLMGVKF